MLNYTITMMQSNDPKNQVTYSINKDEVGSEMEAAQDCFHKSNMVYSEMELEHECFRSNINEVDFNHLRSMSVGDIVKVFDGEDTHWFMCLAVGWAQVEHEFVKPWLDLQFFTRLVHPLTRVEDPIEAMTLRVKMKRGMIPFVEGRTDDAVMQLP
jgi:hypothetical protein